jgi:methionyl-tRNA formyltransferase
MRALILTSNSLRHRYFAKILSKNFDLVGMISEKKKNYYIKEQEKSEFVAEHFERLAESERKYFIEGQDLPELDILELSKNDINSAEAIAWAEKRKPEIIFLFGTGILREVWLDKYKTIINLHLGLSPFYRGSATLFWPFYNNEISCVGATIHLAVKDVDAGAILKRVKPELEVGDDYYSINHKAIKKTIDLIPVVTSEYLDGTLKAIEQDIDPEVHVYKKKDFTEATLKKALANIGEGLSAEQLRIINESSVCNCSQ